MTTKTSARIWTPRRVICKEDSMQCLGKSRKPSGENDCWASYKKSESRRSQNRRIFATLWPFVWRYDKNRLILLQTNKDKSLSQRQTDMLNLFPDGHEAKITSRTWASLAKCSKDTAIRDIQDLAGKEILREDIPDAKRPSYSIIYAPEDITAFLSEIRVEEGNGNKYIEALYRGKIPVCERIVPLDAERLEKRRPIII